MTSPVPSLDTPRPPSRKARMGVAAALGLYAVVVTLVLVNARRPLRPVPAVAVAHALTTFVVAGVTAVVLYAHAYASGRRGYIVLGSTFVALSAVMAGWPLVFPGGILADAPLFGGVQNSVTLFYTWHFGFLVGITGGAWVLARDERTHRRPEPNPPARQMMTAVSVPLVVAGTALGLAAFAPTVLPTLIGPSGSVTALGTFADRALLVSAVACAALMIHWAGGGSPISRWTAAVGLLLLGEAAVNVATPSRYSLGWYYSRLFGLAAFTTLLVALIWNLSRLDRANARLAATDPLTGAESRAGLMQSLGSELARATGRDTQVALLWVDLDGFKSVNDQMGHALGDEVLRAVAQRLRSHVRSGDHVARLGGDEFGVLLCDDTSPDLAERIAERVLDSVRLPITAGESTCLVNASVGIALAPDDAADPDELLMRADLAMYEAKALGGNRHHRFDDRIGRAARERAALRHDLASAIRHRELDLDFQPIIEVSTGGIAGAEALVRWIRGGRRVPAGAFVGVAQSTGQMTALGHLVLDCLERDLPRLLHAGGEQFFVTLNLSVQELADPTLTARLRLGPLHEHVDRVVLEVTESHELYTDSDAERNLAALQAGGYRLAVDDFGAGFSSFERLERLNPSLIKLDRSLVRRAGEETQGGVAFLRAATSVATSLDCDVVAEGVESPAEVEVIAGMAIRWAQGFHFARPMPLGDLCGRVGAGAPSG